MVLPQEVWEQAVSRPKKEQTPEQKKRAEELTRKMRSLSPEERRKLIEEAMKRPKSPVPGATGKM